MEPRAALGRLTEPSVWLTDAPLRRRARLLAGYFLLMVPLTVIYFLLPGRFGNLNSEIEGDGVQWVFLPLTLMLALGLYGLARSRHYLWAARLAVVATTGSATWALTHVASAGADSFQVGLSAAFLAYPVVLAAMLLPVWDVLAALVLAIIAIGLAGTTIPGLDITDKIGSVQSVVWPGVVALSISLLQYLDIRSAQRQRKNLQLIFDASPDPVFVLRDGAVESVNDAGARALGALDQAAVVGQTLPLTTRSYEQDSPRVTPGLERLTLRLPGGVPITVEASTTLVELDDHPVTVIQGRDVRERERAQGALMLSDRLSSVGLVASGVAHEVNNPLTYFLNNLELAEGMLAEPQPDLTKIKGLVSEAKDGAARIAEIMSDVRVFTRGNDTLAQPIDIQSALESAINISRASIMRKARLVTRLGECPRVMGTQARIGQVCLNLLTNAAAASPSVPRGAAVQVHLFTDDDGHAVLHVQDQGGGVPPELLDQIFEPFFTTKGEGHGTGLGLFISRQIVEDFGGTLHVENIPGSGARFVVRLPPATLAAA